MALPPLPESNTERYWLRYNMDGQEHTLQQRVPTGHPSSAVVSAYDQFLVAMAPSLWQIDIVGLERAVIGSNVRNPVVWTGAVSYGLGAPTDITQATTYSFTGRSNDGRKIRAFLFGAKNIGQDDFRTESTESSDIANAVFVLNGLPNGFLSISGLKPVFHAYANINLNQHWVKELRP
jgi:hypothetical protein